MSLNEHELDALAELINVGVGRAASSLSELIGSRIDLRVPVIHVVSPSFTNQCFETGMSIMQSFDGNISGNAFLVFPKKSGQKLAALLGGFEEPESLSELETSGILSEIGNIVLNGVLGSIANTVEQDLSYSVPEFYVQETITSLMNKRQDQPYDESDLVLYADTQFNVEAENIRGSVVVAFHMGSFDQLLNSLMGQIS